MKPALRVMLCDDAGERFFGEGPCRLLHLIEETARCAAQRRRWGFPTPRRCGLCSTPKKNWALPSTCKTIGGRGGGGSTLTAEARQFLERYEAYRDACVQTSRELYSAFFLGQR